MTQSVVLRMPKMHDWQKKVYADRTRFKVLAAGRRWRKTSVGVTKCVEVALRGGDWKGARKAIGRSWWVGPDYPRTRPAWRVLRVFAAMIPGSHTNEAERTVTFPNGGEVTIKSADDPDSLRGEGLDFAIVDEAAYVKKDAWTALRPQLTDRHGGAWFLSTPCGMNWFYDLFMVGKGGGSKDWRSWQRPSTDNTFIRDIAEEIEEYRQLHGEAMTRQEYYADFLDYAALRPFKDAWILRWPSEEDGVDDVYKWLQEYPKYFDVRIGTDQAISMKDKACRSAVVVVAQAVHSQSIHLGKLFVLSAEVGHWSPYDHADRCLDAVEKYGAKIIYYEDVNYQRAFEDVLAARMRDRHITAGVEGVKPDADKLRRAAAWSGLVQNGRVYFGPGQHELTNAMVKVPPESDAENYLWDAVDAAGIVIRKFPAKPAPYQAIGRTPADTAQYERATGYATKSGAALLPDSVPRGMGSRASGQRGFVANARASGVDPRKRLAVGYAVRPQRMMTPRNPGRL